VKKRREELEKFYQTLYDNDSVLIKKQALEYAGGDIQRAKDFLAGYKFSIKQPHTLTIRLINMYTLDHIPYYVQHTNPKNMVVKTRDIFRDKLYPDELFNSSKSVNDEVCKSKITKTSEATEE
jgi:hypothetical protein